jgi:hypothetical protein
MCEHLQGLLWLNEMPVDIPEMKHVKCAWGMTIYMVCLKCIWLYGERVGKLSIEVEGTFMHMLDFFCLATPPEASDAAR